MSNSNKVTLNVFIKDQGEAYQITVLDDAFRTVASGSGNLSVDLLPGIYKVQAHITRQLWENLVLLKPGSETINVDVPILSITSPVPLSNTAQYREYHMHAAVTESHKVHFRTGAGSAIFVFARHYSGDNLEKTSSLVHPFNGMTLHDASGVQIADLQSISASDITPGMDPWAACNILIDPGYYRLRTTLSSGDQVEQPLYTSRGWQLQIFALQSAFCPEPEEVRADLVDASISYAKFNPDDLEQCGGFNPYYPDKQESYRLTELARQGLLEKRPVLKSEINNMMWRKFENPMLGIMGCHLMLINPSPNMDFFGKVIKNLRRMLGVHPDVEALALLLYESETAYLFKTLPMLRKSWNLVLQASVNRPEIVPIDSEASNLSNHLWGEGMWVFSTVKPAEADVNSCSVVKSFVSRQLKQSAFTDYERAVVTQMAATDERQPIAFNPLFKTPHPEELPKLDDITAKMMVETLGIPRGNVELLIQRATDKADLFKSAQTKLPPSTQRKITKKKIVSEIRNATTGNKEDLLKKVAQLLNENSESSRIAAIGILQTQPDTKFFHFIIDAISQSRSAFEQFQALSSAQSFLPKLSTKQKSQLKKVITSQLGDQPEQSIEAGSDRRVLSEMILRKIK
jgi:hypothetical protein